MRRVETLATQLPSTKLCVDYEFGSQLASKRRMAFFQTLVAGDGLREDSRRHLLEGSREPIRSFVHHSPIHPSSSSHHLFRRNLKNYVRKHKLANRRHLFRSQSFIKLHHLLTNPAQTKHLSQKHEFRLRLFSVTRLQAPSQSHTLNFTGKFGQREKETRWLCERVNPMWKIWSEERQNVVPNISRIVGSHDLQTFHRPHSTKGHINLALGKNTIKSDFCIVQSHSCNITTSHVLSDTRVTLKRQKKLIKCRYKTS